MSFYKLIKFIKTFAINQTALIFQLFANGLGLFLAEGWICAWQLSGFVP